MVLLDFRRLHERVAFMLDGERYVVHAECRPPGAFVLEGPAGSLARARRSVLHRWFEVSYDGRHLTVEPASVLGRTYVVNEGPAQVGRIRLGMLPPFRRQLHVEMLPTLPVAVRIFLTWLVVARP
jgi:hypothetical protein